MPAPAHVIIRQIPCVPFQKLLKNESWGSYWKNLSLFPFEAFTAVCVRSASERARAYAQAPALRTCMRVRSFEGRRRRRRRRVWGQLRGDSCAQHMNTSTHACSRCRDRLHDGS